MLCVGLVLVFEDVVRKLEDVVNVLVVVLVVERDVVVVVLELTSVVEVDIAEVVEVDVVVVVVLAVVNCSPNAH